MKQNAHIVFNLPEGYAFRYTLNWLIAHKNLTEGKPITRIQQELSELTKRSPRNIQQWEKIKSDDFKGGISIENAFLIAGYFGIEVKQLLTRHVMKQPALVRKSA